MTEYRYVERLPDTSQMRQAVASFLYESYYTRWVMIVVLKFCIIHNFFVLMKA